MRALEYILEGTSNPEKISKDENYIYITCGPYTYQISKDLMFKDLCGEVLKIISEYMKERKVKLDEVYYRMMIKDIQNKIHTIVYDSKPNELKNLLASLIDAKTNKKIENVKIGSATLKNIINKYKHMQLEAKIAFTLITITYILDALSQYLSKLPKVY